VLELDQVSVRHGTSWAVRDVCAAVAPGEWVGLIGANGAGKSSLLRAIAQLQRHAGTVRVNDRSLRRISRRQQARLVAYVPQAPELPAGMTVVEYTLLGRTPHIGYLSVESDTDRALCLALLQRLGLRELAGRALSALSGGEVQRVVLARALAQQAPVLLLDEPTSALDLGNRVDALELVDELRRERGLTVLSAMHDLTLAAQFTDRLLLLSGGRLAAAGTPAEVLDEALLSRCFGGQVRVLPDDLGGLVVVPVRRERATR
jgi:iron complex transport system ATP-binding protein